MKKEATYYVGGKNVKIKFLLIDTKHNLNR